MKKIYFASDKTGAPLSGAVEVAGLVFVSGQIHLKEGKLVGETIEERFEVAMDNVAKVLTEAGVGLNEVVKVQLYLTNLGELPALNEVYGDYFGQPLPARTAVGVAALPLGASLEIEVVAARGD